MSSNAVTRLSVEIAGSEISFETGRIAKQAGGAVVVRQGDTMVLATATAGDLRDADFLPLTVDVEERMYAAGKIPGSFFKREGRAGEKGTLTARMIDRPIRPLFPKGWRYETQIVAIPLSVDHVHPYDILAMNGASAALMISDIPLPTPVGAVRIGKIDGNFVVNPREEDLLGAQRPGPDRRRHRGRDPDGRGGRPGDPRGGDPRRARHRPRRDQEALRAAARAGREGRQGQARGRRPAGRRRRCSSRSAPPTAPRWTRRPRSRRSSSARTRPRPSRPAVLEQYAGDPDERGLRRASRGRAAGLRQAREGDHPRAHRGRRRSAPTGAPRTRSATSRSRSASRRARTAPRSSRAARRRR